MKAPVTLDRATKFAAVAIIKSTGHGTRLDPPIETGLARRMMPSQKAAIEFAVSMGWGVHLTK